jgi:hypothetical protein
MRNPRFNSLLKQLEILHDKKNHDYSNNTDPYSNFKYAAAVAEPFTDKLDKVFATMIGIKMARLAELTSSGKKPNNESVNETRIDLACYAVIWTSMYIDVMTEMFGSYVIREGA